eukprot:4038498-Pleurochrysis_carterae.AAC.1
MHIEAGTTKRVSEHACLHRLRAGLRDCALAYEIASSRLRLYARMMYVVLVRGVACIHVKSSHAPTYDCELAREIACSRTKSAPRMHACAISHVLCAEELRLSLLLATLDLASLGEARVLHRSLRAH